MNAAYIREVKRLTAQGADLLAIERRQRDLTGGPVLSEEEEAAAERRKAMSVYVGNPVLYAEKVLGVKFWDVIGNILTEAEKAPYRTNVKSGHKIGKTHSCAAYINYWFDVYDPGVVITTGASYDAMKDTVWSEVRMQRRRANLEDHFIGPVAPEMRTSPEHWAKLFSVNDATSFQGKHRSRILFLFDESVGVDREMFLVAETMFKSEPGFCWICFCNPTDPSSQIYAEEQLLRYDRAPKWRTYSISSLEHPNVIAQREARERGDEKTSSECEIPSAVSISQIDDWVADWCIEIDPAAKLATDFEWIWPDGRRTWHRPQADWEARCLGKWPSQAMWSVWSEHLFTLISEATATVPVHLLPEIGGDVARFGDDKSTVHGRWGGLSLVHGARKGLRTTEMAGWLKETARDLAEFANQARHAERAGRPIVRPQEIPIKVDDDGVGGGVVDELFADGYNVIPIGAGTVPMDPSRYLNKRSELWFTTVRRAQAGGIAFCSIGSDGKSYCRLDRDAVQRLKLQAVAPKWKLATKGQRVVEAKADTKKRLGYSPDDMDAMNLAYYEFTWEAPHSVAVPIFDDRQLGPQRPSGDEEWNDQGPPRAERRKLFGR